MNGLVILQAYAEQFGIDRLPLRTPVLVGGKPGHITGRSFSSERYDVMFEEDNSIWHSIPREKLELNWVELRR